jgi:hypothetical protein
MASVRSWCVDSRHTLWFVLRRRSLAYDHGQWTVICVLYWLTVSLYISFLLQTLAGQVMIIGTLYIGLVWASYTPKDSSSTRRIYHEI